MPKATIAEDVIACFERNAALTYNNLAIATVVLDIVSRHASTVR